MDDNDLDAIAAAFEESIIESEWTTVNQPPTSKGLRETEWNEPDPAILDDLVYWSTFAADTVVIEGRRTGSFPTPAEETRAAVKAALRLLLANGLITAVPFDSERWIAMSPPDGGNN